ncbi:MAG TPA: RNA methyltransferase [Ignavibacteriaceae bacterium]|nr:RNA methyltransferase [Ignavibacteriaceae bacterium]
MITKKKLAYYSSLLKKKHRSEEKKFLAEGKKIIGEAIAVSFWIKNLEFVLATNEFMEKENGWVNSVLNERVGPDKISIIKNSEFKKISDTINAQGIVAVFKAAEFGEEISEKGVICLENISDPGNIGSILRNCDWFGINEIIIGEGCADIYNPKTIRASSGSIFHLKFFNQRDHINYLLSLKNLKYKIITADLEGESIYSFTRPEKFVLVFSNEANGPSGSLLEISDEIIKIPKKGRAESLNVSAASAVILNQLFK